MVSGARVDARVAKQFRQRLQRHVSAEKLRSALSGMVDARSNSARGVVHVNAREVHSRVNLRRCKGNNARLFVVVDLLETSGSREAAHIIDWQRHRLGGGGDRAPANSFANHVRGARRRGAWLIN